MPKPTLKEVEASFAEFKTTTTNYTPENIRAKENDFRLSYEQVGKPLEKNPDIEKELRKAVKRAHRISERIAARQLFHSSNDGRGTYEQVETWHKHILEHCEGLGMPIREGSKRDLTLYGIYMKAHKKCGEVTLAMFEGDEVYWSGNSFSDYAIQIYQHKAVLDEPVEVGSDFYNQVWDAVGHMCRISGLGDNATNQIFDQIEKWFAARNEQRENDRTPADYLPHEEKKAKMAEIGIAELERMAKLDFHRSKTDKHLRVIDRNRYLTQRSNSTYDFH